MWSPTHPALFACVDGMGRLDLWNLNNDTEVPTASISVEGNPALNRVRWTHSGREIAVGDSEGQIVIYDVGEVWSSLPIILIHLFSFHNVVLTLSLGLKLVFEVHELYKLYGCKDNTVHHRNDA
ncbi:dynein cytoplasmic 1 intermediate chain 2 [Phyllostomus discolor]|uniref:Dynein cytoplasmic 1 intermediate chain 2 n=1 Tax=Phyllostomus discolor TaxID=89673 RepID=A0A834AL85_9CHIR|nr:dynein cytoplasmic 1 intermediate chain 2 [Phyllostomus discolor]